MFSSYVRASIRKRRDELLAPALPLSLSLHLSHQLSRETRSIMRFTHFAHFLLLALAPAGLAAAVPGPAARAIAAPAGVVDDPKLEACVKGCRRFIKPNTSRRFPGSLPARPITLPLRLLTRSWEQWIEPLTARPTASARPPGLRNPLLLLNPSPLLLPPRRPPPLP
jgi:hypothetical protein